jgi:eukaryotic-like serine/threonine-protein kinase
MGATLFHLLAGRPPFLGRGVEALRAMHTSEPPPPLRKINADVSEAVAHIVDKALAKNPDARYDDAGAMLEDLERVLRGEPTSIVIHPRLPACAPNKLFQFDWTWDLEASPEQLWPFVSNTERFNRAAGLPSVRFTTQIDSAGGVRRIGEFRKAGFTNVWREYPFEWVERRRMGVLRVYSQGVFNWLATMTELHPRAGGGTRLTHQVRIDPRGLIGRLVARVEVGIRGRRTVEKVYRRMDAFLTGGLARSAGADAFENPPALTSGRRARLDQMLDKLLAAPLSPPSASRAAEGKVRRVDPVVVAQMGEFVRCASVQEVARIRPIALANRLGLDAEEVVTVCLLGAREGLLVLLWDILCPVCRISATIKDTLRELREHEHCEACNLDFQVDFANSVEMIFRVHPEIRVSDLGTYCIGGPVHSPHVAAQVRIAPGERMELELALTEGVYRLRGPQLPWAIDLHVRPTAALTRWDLDLSPGLRPAPSPPLRVGRQLLALSNTHEQELLLRVERTAPRADALTAARASALAAFRDWFPGEVLSAGQLVGISTVTLLVAELDHAGNLYQQLGDARAFAVVQDYFGMVDEAVRREGGALIKTVGEAMVASFPDPAAAVRAALELPQKTAERLSARSEVRHLGLRPRIGIHRGPVLATTLNGSLDYFGATVSLAARLPGLTKGGDIVLTQSVAGDPQVAALLQLTGRGLEVLPGDPLERTDVILHRLLPLDSRLA